MICYRRKSVTPTHLAVNLGLTALDSETAIHVEHVVGLSHAGVIVALILTKLMGFRSLLFPEAFVPLASYEGSQFTKCS